MPTFEIVCLANSRKWHGRCVAGLRTDGAGWLRPIGPGEYGVLHSYHYTLADNTQARVLDVLRIACSRSASTPHHPEDWLAVPAPWQLVSRPAPAGQIAWLRGLLTDDPFLQHNSRDRIAYDALLTRPITSSLALVAPENLHWEVRAGRDDGQKENEQQENEQTKNSYGNGYKKVDHKKAEQKIRVCFTLGGRDYNLALTYRLLEARLQHLPVGFYPRHKARVKAEDEIWLTLSLSEPFTPMEGGAPYCYKLVAAVITVPVPGKVSGVGTRRRGTRQTASNKIHRGIEKSDGVRIMSAVAKLAPDAYPDPFAHFHMLEGITVQGLTARKAEVPAEPKTVPTIESQIASDAALQIDSNIEPNLESLPEVKREVSAWKKRIDLMRLTVPRAFMSWTKAEDVVLKQLMVEGAEVSAIAARMERHEGAVRKRIEKFEG